MFEGDFRGLREGLEVRGAKNDGCIVIFNICKLLIFRVYFTGAGCSYIYRYSCTLHLPFILSFLCCITMVANGWIKGAYGGAIHRFTIAISDLFCESIICNVTCMGIK